MDRRQHIGDRRELLIGEVYKAILGAGPLANALGELAQATKSDKAYWGCFDLRRSAGYLLDSFNVKAEFVERYNSRLSSNDPWFLKSQYFQAEGLIWRGSKIVPMQDLVVTDFHREYLAPQEIFHTLHIVIMIEGNRVTHVMLTRPQHQPDFEEADIEIAQCFALHARRAFESQRTVSGLSMVQSGLAEIMDDAGLGVAILDPPAVIYASRLCESILASLGAPRAAKNGGHAPRASHSYFPRLVAEAIAAHDYEATTHLVLDRPDGNRVLVSIKPVVFAALTGYGRRIGLIVTLLDLSMNVLVDREFLQHAYDLTASEARVCSLLANGDTVEDVSEQLNISPNTARTHIKRIFGKTGVTRQAGLVRLLTSTAILQRRSQHEPPRAVGRDHP